MDWNLFWTAFGAIGATTGALATTAAVIVALWQVKYNERKKLKLHFSASMVVHDQVLQTKKFFVRLSATNVGNRDIIISGWGYVFFENDGYGLIGLTESPIEQQINPSMPHRLKIEEQVSLYWEHDFFAKSVKSDIEAGLLRRNKKISFFVLDSTGQMYKVKTSKTASEYTT